MQKNDKIYEIDEFYILCKLIYNNEYKRWKTYLLHKNTALFHQIK